MPNRFYRRRWDEARGDEFASWGRSFWYFETDEEGWPVRQIEVYEAGRVTRYGPEHDDDRYGGLGEASLYDSGEDWSTYEIADVEFERIWHSDSGVTHNRQPRPDSGRTACADRAARTLRCGAPERLKSKRVEQQDAVW
jgi:hypothetical protein